MCRVKSVKVCTMKQIKSMTGISPCRCFTAQCAPQARRANQTYHHGGSSGDEDHTTNNSRSGAIQSLHLVGIFVILSEAQCEILKTVLITCCMSHRKVATNFMTSKPFLPNQSLCFVHLTPKLMTSDHLQAAGSIAAPVGVFLELHLLDLGSWAQPTSRSLLAKPLQTCPKELSQASLVLLFDKALYSNLCLLGANKNLVHCPRATSPNHFMPSWSWFGPVRVSELLFQCAIELVRKKNKWKTIPLKSSRVLCSRKLLNGEKDEIKAHWKLFTGFLNTSSSFCSYSCSKNVERERLPGNFASKHVTPCSRPVATLRFCAEPVTRLCVTITCEQRRAGLGTWA